MSALDSLQPTLPQALQNQIDERLLAARESAPQPWAATLADARVAGSLGYVWSCSEFIASSCQRDAQLLPGLIDDGRLFGPIDAAWLLQDLQQRAEGASGDADLMQVLRRYRRRQMVRIAWRDLAGWADLGETLADLSALADVCVSFVYEHANAAQAARYGQPRGVDSGEVQPLVILGMGKLGGRELNYSSDIDLIFLYPEEGETDGERSIDNAEYFLRLGQRIIQLLANTTPDGFVFRVDMRLRPFGDSGRLAVSFDSFETYLQQHGRDWERYAFVKARPITGVQHHRPLYENVLRPFVYRRYLDFAVFESLRGMKEMIAREVERRELRDNIKLGPGGIREIEFIVQAFQLVRGGSDRRLQSRELQTVLPHLVGQKFLSERAVRELGEAYRFLRRLENRLQEWNDQSTHMLPTEADARLHLALAMKASDWEALSTELEGHRARVSAVFASVVFGPASGTAAREAPADNLLADSLGDADRQKMLAAMGLAGAASIAQQLGQLRESAYYRRLDEIGRRRLQELMPRVMAQLVPLQQQDLTFARMLRILEMIGGRTVYLALLNENAIALERLVDLCSQSQFLADQVAAFPLLLDELIDERLFEALPTRGQFWQELDARMQSARHEDPERQVETLREFQRATLFRIAVADLTGRLPLMKVSDRLTDLAELIVQEALAMAWAQITERHGVPMCGPDGTHLRPADVVVVAYGKFGGLELGYSSDLDLVFLHDSGGEVQRTEGASPIENTVFFARLGQRLVHLLTVHTRAGRLYEVDIRLRPSGKGGLLVQSLASFDDYQRKEAWTWEHQALLRARAVAGHPDLRAAFERVRVDVLRQAVRRDSLRDEVRKMRERMRQELSKAKPGQFDLKQDAGGIADIEFLVQYWMLRWADDYPPIIIFSDNIRQLESLASGNLVPQSEVDFLTSTYRKYRERMHHLALAGSSDVVDAEEFVEERRKVVQMWNAVMVE